MVNIFIGLPAIKKINKNSYNQQDLLT